jgi:hypothetical protein
MGMHDRLARSLPTIYSHVESNDGMIIFQDVVFQGQDKGFRVSSFPGCHAEKIRGVSSGQHKRMVCRYRVFIPDPDHRPVFFDDPAFNMITAKRAIILIGIQVCHVFSSPEVNKIGVIPFPPTWAVCLLFRTWNACLTGN